jgi:hypothetical protein
VGSWSQSLKVFCYVIFGLVSCLSALFYTVLFSMMKNTIVSCMKRNLLVPSACLSAMFGGRYHLGACFLFDCVPPVEGNWITFRWNTLQSKHCIPSLHQHLPPSKITTHLPSKMARAQSMIVSTLTAFPRAHDGLFNSSLSSHAPSHFSSYIA